MQSFENVRRRFRRSPEGNGEAVPRIDGVDSKSQVNQLALAEGGAGLDINIVRHMAAHHVSDRFGPGEGGAFAIGVPGRLAPGNEPVKPVVIDPVFFRLPPVHCDAEGAAVHLRSPKKDQMQQSRVEGSGGAKVAAGLAEKPNGLGSCAGIIKTLGHRARPPERIFTIWMSRGWGTIPGRSYSPLPEDEDDPDSDELLVELEGAGAAGFSDLSPEPEDSAAFPLPSAEAFMALLLLEA